MEDLLKKLKYKSHDRIAVINAPEDFTGKISAVLPGVQVDTEINARFLYDFMITFASSSEDVKKYSPSCIHNLFHDGKLWLVYPKGTSKRYSTDLNRDHGWEILEEAGFRRVSQISVDDDWSALRFRNVKYVKSNK